MAKKFQDPTLDFLETRGACYTIIKNDEMNTWVEEE